MNYNPFKHHRRSIRLRGYDYRQPGAYYVTLTVQDRRPLLGRIIDGKVLLSVLGEIVHEEWLRTTNIRPEVRLDEFVIMPDHMHGIIEILEERNGVPRWGESKFAPTNATPFRSPSKSVGAIIRGFKGASTKRINELRNTRGERFWQRNYYEHVIRGENDYSRIQRYINENPMRASLEIESRQSL
jgi:putative transposase